MQDNKKLKRRVRRSYAISTVSIALVLFLLGSVGYLIINALSVTNRMKESISLYVMLKGDLEEGAREGLGEQLAKEEGVREVIYVSKEAAAREFIEHSGDDFEQFLEFNPLPDSYEVKLTAQGSESEWVKSFENKILLWDGIDEVVYQRSVVDRVGSNINKFNLILMIFGGALLVISLILLNNTIRVTILSKRYAISTMKLVGATSWFIMRPFLKSAALQGIYSGLIAAIMFVAMVSGINEGLPEIGISIQRVEVLWIVGAMFILGVLISLTFTLFSVRKVTRMATDAIYYY